MCTASYRPLKCMANWLSMNINIRYREKKLATKFSTAMFLGNLVWRPMRKRQFFT